MQHQKCTKLNQPKMRLEKSTGIFVVDYASQLKSLAKVVFASKKGCLNIYHKIF
ncbi:MAG TPA: hypothetical protein VF817_00120 [Patescibacteria group bacterium]